MTLTVTVPVKDLNKTREFFSALGFAFNPELTGDHAANMIVNDTTSFMFLAESFFQTLTPRKIADTSNTVEYLCSISVDSKEAVDAFVDKAISMGGHGDAEGEDHGFMYSRGVYDLDGHGWNVLWMNANA